MSALQYLDLFDRILKHKLAELAKKSHDRKKVANTLLCKEFVTYKGIRRSGLLNFIGWLISNNEREIQFAGKCHIKFIHSNSDLNLLKIIYFANSQCNVHKQLSDWTGRVVVNWQRYCEKQRQLGVKIEHDDFDIGDTLNLSAVSLSEQQSSATLTTVSSNQSLQLLSYSSEKSFTDSGIGIQKDSSNEEAPIVSDIYAMLEEMEVKIRSMKMNYAQSGGLQDAISKQEIFDSLVNLSARQPDAANGDLVETFKLMDHQVSLLRDIQLSNPQQSDFSAEPMRSFMTTLWEEDEYVDVTPSATVTTPGDKDDDAADNKSAGSNFCSSMTVSDLSSIQAGGYATVAPDMSRDDYKPKNEFVVASLPLTLETLNIHKSKTENSLSIDGGDFGRQHRSCSAPVLTMEVDALQEQVLRDYRQCINSGTMTADKALATSIERSRSYNFVMARVRSSDSLSSLVEDNKSSSYDLTEQESENVGMLLDNFEQSSKQFKLKINISDLPKSTRGLMTLFNIVSPSVFDGELVAKKSSTDFMYKKRYLWINPVSRSLHWAKHEKSEDKSKFFMLKRNRSGQKPAGLIQGVVHSAEFGPKGLVICTENGSYLELKLPPSTLADWERVFLTLI